MRYLLRCAAFICGIPSIGIWGPGLACLLVLSGCQAPLPVVEVVVLERAAEVRQLEVRARLNERLLEGASIVSSRLDRFRLGLPSVEQGELHVEVFGQDERGCRIQMAPTASLPLTGALRYSVTVSLSALSTPSCQLVVDMPEQGRGSVSIEPLSQTCEPQGAGAASSCTYSLSPLGAKARLIPQAEPDSYFAGWLGACRGSGLCEIESRQELTTVVARFLPKKLCSAGWCWSNPLPNGSSMAQIWGASPSDMWAVGSAGTILHWDGAAWTPLTSVKTESGKVFANNLHAIWGSGTSDVWAVGDNGSSVHFNGARWTALAPPTSDHLVGVWGSANPAPSAAANNVWAIGEQGTVLRWDGTAWAVVALANTMISLGRAVWTNGPNDVWIAGLETAISINPLWHWDGTRWQQPTIINVPLPKLPDKMDVFNFWGSGPSDLWAVGKSGAPGGGLSGLFLHWDGAGWQVVAPSSPIVGTLSAVRGTTAQDIWAVGSAGVTAHWNGSTWSVTFADTEESLTGVWGNASDDFWATEGNGGGILRWNGAHWLRVGLRSGSAKEIKTLWGSSANDIWAAGEQAAFLHWDGSSWRLVQQGSPSDRVNAIWGGPLQDTWAVGSFGSTKMTAQARVSRLRSGRWEDYPLSAAVTLKFKQLDDVWGSGANDVWAVGPEGVLRWDGASWSNFTLPATLPPANISSAQLNFVVVAGTAANDIWAVARHNATTQSYLVHWDGAAGSLRTAEVIPQTAEILYRDLAVHSQAGISIWLAGIQRATGTEVLLRGAPGSLSLLPGLPSAPSEPRTLLVNSPNDVWIGGDHLQHWDGVTLQTVAVSTTGAINTLWGTAGDTWLGGEFGMIMQRSAP